MNRDAIKELTTKYTKKEITTAVGLLRDVLKLSSVKEVFKVVDASKELTPKQIARIKLQEKARLSGKAKYISANKVWDELGI